MRRRGFPVSTALAFLLAIAADRLSKLWVVSSLELEVPWAPVPALGKWFTFTYIHNTGAAFGMFPQAGTLFAVVQALVLVGLILWYDRLPVHHLPVRAAVGLIMAGALGNLIDRLTTRYVVDFLDFKFWPIFNLADSAVVVGVVILGLYMLLGEEASPEARASTECMGREQSPGV